MPLDFDACRAVLERCFERAENRSLAGQTPQIGEELAEACEKIFASRTQTYREVLIGVVLARLQDKSINVRHPWTQYDHGFSGRMLDQNVVNPFLRSKSIPVSTAPYLSAIRRGVTFEPATRAGQRDKRAFDALLTIIGAVETELSDSALEELLTHLLFRFLVLREDSRITLANPPLISHEQLTELVRGLLNTPSGGRFPLFVSVALFRAINQCFELGWTVEYQSINAPDAQSGKLGDIEVKRGDSILFAAEVTERTVEGGRVSETFRTKIAPSSLDDYMFLVSEGGAADSAREQARRYLAQGSEIVFLEVLPWVHSILGTLGKRGRRLFCDQMLELLSVSDTPKKLRVDWNDGIARVVG